MMTMESGLEREALPVTSSVRRVARESRWVKLHPEHVERAVVQWGLSPAVQSGWHHPCHYFDATVETVRWIFVVDVLNHCFWPGGNEKTWAVDYHGTWYSGYWGLAASLRRAMEEGIPVTDSSFLAGLGEKDLEAMLRGMGRAPLFRERLSNLREAGRILLAEWEGDITRLVEAARGSAVEVVRLVVSSFPSFRDEAVYRGQRVFFWKRAQIFAADLYSAFGGRSWGAFRDIDQLTAFADYKLPQVLRVLGILSYHPDLARRIERRELLEPGGEEEVEIRALTIMAVEECKQAFHAVGIEHTSMQVDHWLWQLGQVEAFREIPYHRCRTIYY